METLIMTLAFSTAVAVAGAVVLAFSGCIDAVLPTLMPDRFAQAWSRYAKFGVFTWSFAGGLRLPDLGALAGGAFEGPPSAGRALLEVFRSVNGTLLAACYILLAFFGAALVAYAAERVFEALKPRAEPRRERHGEMAGRY